MTGSKNNKCVYLHKDQEGVIRYVGLGSIYRAKDWGKRNDEWVRLFSVIRPIVEIVQKNLSLDDACSLESELIQKYKDTVCNVFTSNKVIKLDFEALNSAFYIDPTSKTGLRWKVSNGLNPAQPNHRKAGDEAGTLLASKYNRGSYWRVKYRYVGMQVHRIIYILHHGSIDAAMVINHKDGNSLNNSVDNLEQITQSRNITKAAREIKSTSGIKNISEFFRDGLLVGYLVCKISNGVRTLKHFTSTRYTPEENKVLALEFLAKLKELNNE